MINVTENRILALGIYLLDVPNAALEISAALIKSNKWSVDLRWAAVGESSVPQELNAATHLVSRVKQPKFTLINQLLRGVDLSCYRYLVVTDDDISLPKNFIDSYLAVVEEHRLSLAQPARTHDSFIDHYFVAQLLGVEARETRFVEIGPLFSIESSAFPVLLPFDEQAPMGWGLDHVWPQMVARAGLRMGIVDCAPVTHSMRKPVSYYDYATTRAAMDTYLDSHDHLTLDQAMTIVQSFPESGL